MNSAPWKANPIHVHSAYKRCQGASWKWKRLVHGSPPAVAEWKRKGWPLPVFTKKERMEEVEFEDGKKRAPRRKRSRSSSSDSSDDSSSSE